MTPLDELERLLGAYKEKPSICNEVDLDRALRNHAEALIEAANRAARLIYCTKGEAEEREAEYELDQALRVLMDPNDFAKKDAISRAKEGKG
jgi:hypothetical protein